MEPGRSEARNQKPEPNQKPEAGDEQAATPANGDAATPDSSRGRFDMEERTARFGEAIIRFAKKIPVTPVTRRLIEQLTDAGTSVGANDAAASDAESRRDFHHKIGICRKESRESKHWLRMSAVAAPELADEARVLWKEAKELNLIFGSMTKNRRR